MAKTKRTRTTRKTRTSGQKRSKSKTRGRIDNAMLYSRMFDDVTPPDRVAELEAYVSFTGAKRLERARAVIQESIIDATASPDDRFAIALQDSESLLAGYATLDKQHRAEIESLVNRITAYLSDSTRKRPFNALMLAAPGAGKSHFIRQLAESMREKRVQAVTFNMATMQSPDDMAQPIDELRNLKVNDRFPLLFLDEFDSDPSRYASLLPLLWDGELQIGHRDLKLGKAVIVLAGSNPDLPKAMDRSAQMGLEVDLGDGTAPLGKLIDLLSRINGGVVNIPDLDLRSQERDRRVDKVCVAVSLIRARFGVVHEVPRILLRFIAHTSFRYGVRSIAHLIDLIETTSFKMGRLSNTDLGLPLSSEVSLQDSSLRLRLVDKDQCFGIVNRWNEFAKDKTVVAVEQARAHFLATVMSDRQRWLFTPRGARGR